MTSELLKTIFLQNEVDFRSIDLLAAKENIANEMPKKSQIDYSILAYRHEIFIALNPATRKFNLSQLNKVTGKKLSQIEKKEENTLNNNLLKAMPQNLKSGIHIFIDEALEYQDELFLVDENEKQAYAIDIKQLQKLWKIEILLLILIFRNLKPIQWQE